MQNTITGTVDVKHNLPEMNVKFDMASSVGRRLSIHTVQSNALDTSHGCRLVISTTTTYRNRTENEMSQNCPRYTEAFSGNVAVQANKRCDLPSYLLVAVPGVRTQELNHKKCQSAAQHDAGSNPRLSLAARNRCRPYFSSRQVLTESLTNAAAAAAAAAAGRQAAT